MRPVTSKVLTIVLLAAGGTAWLVVGNGGPYARWMGLALIAAAVASLVPASRDAIAARLDRFRAAAPAHRRRIALVVFVAAAAYLTITAHWQGRGMYPKSHDEQSYALQAQMLARGRLWMDPHPLADAFDTVYVLTRPVYASMYFAGAALAYVPMVWLGTPMWVVPVLLAAAAATMLYRVGAELVDDVAGLLAALLLLSLIQFRMISVTLHSHVPLLVQGALMWWLWLRWRRDEVPRPAWAAALGAVAGWAAITRPIDAVAFAAPVAVAVLVDLWRRRRLPRGRVVATLAAGAAAAVPFVALQLVANHGITGSWRTTPHEFYVDRDFPRATLGFHAVDPSARPASIVPQKQMLYDTWAVPAVRGHRVERLGAIARERAVMTMYWALPAVPLVALAAAGLAGAAADPRRWVVLATLPLFFGLYLLYPWYLPHYTVTAAPSAALAVVIGADQVRRAFPRAAASLGTFLTLAIALFALGTMPELNPDARDEYVTPQLDAMNDALGGLPHRPAVVLFKAQGRANIHEEPVYNTDVAWPDDADVVRAHDLGQERNLALLRYYAERQPERHVYFLDRAGNVVTYRGQAGPLWERLKDLAGPRERPTTATTTTTAPSPSSTE